jgi:hypothetical protein
VGDFSALLDQTSLGVVADSTDDLQSFAGRVAERLPALTGESMRRACQALAAEHFDIVRKIGLYRELAVDVASSDRVNASQQ